MVLSLRTIVVPVRLSMALDCLIIPSESFASSAETSNGLGRGLKAKAGPKSVAGISKPGKGTLLGGDSRGVHTIGSPGNTGVPLDELVGNSGKGIVV